MFRLNAAAVENGIAEATHLLAMYIGCRIWFEWVDTNANPSDGLSRDGLSDPAFGNMAKGRAAPSWQSCPTFSERISKIRELCGLGGDIV